ncbi:MAG: aminodeoxychorismate/anthranilate synthase component II, partial [Bacteroidota bacterium]|nr:aminodeoxychorismate/anthranilate synthase component II [Bacteroidota bacterium]
VANKVSKPLEVIAETSKGEVMALAHASKPIVGLQFHPESILTEVGYALLGNFFTHVEKL